MEIIDLTGGQGVLTRPSRSQELDGHAKSDISIACWEPGQTSPIHHHPADEIYHVTRERVFNDGRIERGSGPVTRSSSRPARSIR